MVLAKSPARIRIRSFGAADAEICAGIFDRAWHAGHPYAPRRIDSEILAEETRNEQILVAETEHGEIAGFTAIYEPEAFVHHLYVDPSAQGLGIGRSLLERAVELAGGAASLKCQTRNPAALGFYRRLGWREADHGSSEFGPWVRLRFP